MSAKTASDNAFARHLLKKRIAADPRFWSEKCIVLKNAVPVTFLYENGTRSISGGIVAVHLERALMKNITDTGRPDNPPPQLAPYLENLTTDILYNIINEL